MPNQNPRTQTTPEDRVALRSALLGLAADAGAPTPGALATNADIVKATLKAKGIGFAHTASFKQLLAKLLVSLT